MPSTKIGKWAGVLLAPALTRLALFFGLVVAGQRAGDAWFAGR